MNDTVVLYRILVFSVLFFWLPTSGHAQNLPSVTIGFISDGPSPRFENRMAIIQQEIQVLSENEFRVRFPESKQINGNWQLDRIQTGVESLLADSGVDMIIATDPIGSHLLGQQTHLVKPVIAATIIDAKLQGIPMQNNASGVRNLSYIVSQKSFERDVNLFHGIIPFKHLSLLVTDPFLKAMPDLEKKVQWASQQYAIEFAVIPVADQAEAALNAIPAHTDAVLVTPLMRLSETAFETLAQGLIQKKLPSYSLWGRQEVEAGLLASATPKSDDIRVARRIALNVNRILLGEKAATLPVRFNAGERLVINMETARKSGFFPSWRVLSRARLIHDQPLGASRQLTLETAVQASIEVNLDLLAAEQEVAAGQENVSQARAPLFPQVEATVSGQWRNPNLANTFNPERSATGAARVSQIIYADGVWAQLQISGKQQQALEQQRNSLRLDIISQTATAYLKILEAKTIERIRRDNVERSRINLELARARESVGASSRSDLFRWQSQIATDQQQVLGAEARRQQSEVTLNRILNRPQEEPMMIEPAQLTDPVLMVSDPRFFKYMDNQKIFRTFRDFMVEEGLARSPEVQALQVSIEAQARDVLAAKRNYWLPDISLNGGYSDTFERNGVGAELPPGGGDSGWDIGLSARLPILTGGAQAARLRQTRKDLQRLKHEIASARNQTEARIRSALLKIGASYPSIELAQEAAHAANNNLALITDTYQKGATSVITLIDAQNVALTTQLSAANAVYTFLLDLMDVQRATAQFDFFLGATEREIWYERLEAYCESRSSG